MASVVPLPAPAIAEPPNPAPRLSQREEAMFSPAVNAGCHDGADEQKEGCEEDTEFHDRATFADSLQRLAYSSLLNRGLNTSYPLALLGRR